MLSLLPSMSRTLTRGGRFSGVHWWPVLGVHRGYFGFLAEYEGTVVGGGGVWLRPILPRPGALQGAVEAYVLNVYTEPDHRRAGVARAIMEAIIDWSREQRIARITLHASKDGRSLYETLGFEPTNEMRTLLG